MFLKFLIEKKQLTSDQALELSISYLEKIPSLLKVIKEDNVLASEKVMEIYFMAALEKKSFQEKFIECSGLTKADLDKILKNRQLRAISLGEIAVSSGILTQEKWDSYLGEYLKNVPKELRSSSDEKINCTTEAKKVDENSDNDQGGISLAALESLKEVSGFSEEQIKELESKVTTDQDSEDLAPRAEEKSPASDINVSIYKDEFFTLFDEVFQSELLVLANRYRLKKKEKDLCRFHQNLTKILSLMKLCEFNFLIKLISPYENLMNLVMDNKRETPENWESLVSEMLDLVWIFRKRLFEKEPEKKIISSAEIKDRYLQNLQNIMNELKR